MVKCDASDCDYVVSTRTRSKSTSRIKSDVKTMSISDMMRKTKSAIKSPKRKIQERENHKKDITTPKGKKQVESIKGSLKKLNVIDKLDDSEEDETPKKKSPRKEQKYVNENPLVKAKMVLSTSYVKNIVGREEECQTLSTFITKHLDNKTSSSLYISGPTGTGKSACVNYVVNHLLENDPKTPFQLININCMICRNASSIYRKILLELSPQRSGQANDCLQEIKSLLTQKSKREKDMSMIVIVLDEIDQLESKSQQVLHTIFEWPTLTNSRLILIGIANALDFTSRILKRFHTLGILPEREMSFTPYSRDEIVNIIEERMRSISGGQDGDSQRIILKPSAIQLCARKVSSFSGDIRKALDVCRRAIDLIEPKSDSTSSSPLKSINDDQALLNASPRKAATLSCVDVPQIMTVLNQVYGQSQIQSNSKINSKHTLPFQQQVILCSLLTFIKQKKVKEVLLGKFYEVYCKVCSKRGISSDGNNESQFLSMCELLEVRGFMTIKRNQNVRSIKLSLKINEEEIEHALSEKYLLKSILNDN